MNRETGTKILLIGSFAASLVLPTLVYPAVRSHLDQQNYENRELASFPELSAANFDNIPTEFEAYYNDHVPFKNLFVKAKTKLDLELLNESSISDVTVGKENWLFYTVSEDGEDALADYQRTNLYTADEKTALADAITSVNEKMKERGIRFVMFEAPNKESVYAEYMPDSVRVYGSESRLDAALPELAAQGLPVYDMKPELLKEADTYQLYYKYDTHWNQIGSFIGSQQIAQTLLGTSTPLSAVSIEAAGPASGDLARMLNMAAEYSDDTEYVIQNYLPEVTATTVDMNEDNSFAVFESDSPNDKTLLVVGDSFSQNLKYFMPKLYRKTVFATFDTYTEALLDALELYRAQAAFFCTPEFMAEQGDLLRRMAATGQAIGILADAADREQTVAEQLEAGNQALLLATCGKTRLACVQNGDDQDRATARAAGYRCLEADFNQSGQGLSSTNAPALLQRLSSHRGDVTLWLGDHTSAAGLRAFLAAAEDADGQCLAWTETA